MLWIAEYSFKAGILIGILFMLAINLIVIGIAEAVK